MCVLTAATDLTCAEAVSLSTRPARTTCWAGVFVTALKEPEGPLQAARSGPCCCSRLLGLLLPVTPEPGPRPSGWLRSGGWQPLTPCSPPTPARPRERRLQAVRGLARIRAFFNAPVVVFHLNTLSYFAFLCLFAYVLMVDFQPSPSGCECLIYLWLFSLVCEELRQVRRRPGPILPRPSPSQPPPLPRLRPFLAVARGPMPSLASRTHLLRAGRGPLERTG